MYSMRDKETEMKETLLSLSAEENGKKRKALIGYYKFWVVLTYFSVVSAIIGMYFALSGSLILSLICLMICGLCDMLDGPVAQRKKRSEREKSFGIQIDSLADLISFGVFPVVIGFAVCFGDFSQELVSFRVVMYIAVFTAYVLAALIRLAYFNVIEAEIQSKREKRKYYEGMPVTMVSMLIPLVYTICLITGASLAAVYPVMLLLITVAFITKIKVPKIKGRYLVIFLLIGLPIAVFLVWSIGAGL
jgi:CDP-diacylglycerol--serine O-phosphatidyltransferase